MRGVRSAPPGGHLGCSISLHCHVALAAVARRPRERGAGRLERGEGIAILIVSHTARSWIASRSYIYRVLLDAPRRDKRKIICLCMYNSPVPYPRAKLRTPFDPVLLGVWICMYPRYGGTCIRCTSSLVLAEQYYNSIHPIILSETGLPLSTPTWHPPHARMSVPSCATARLRRVNTQLGPFHDV